MARRRNNICVADHSTIEGDDLTCLSARSEKANLWYSRLGHVSFFLFNKLVSRDLVHGLPKMKLIYNKVYNACVKGKHTRSSIQSKEASMLIKIS